MICYHRFFQFLSFFIFIFWGGWVVLFIFSPCSFSTLVCCHNVSVWPFITWRTMTLKLCLNPVTFHQCYYKIFAASHFSLEGPLRWQLCTISSMPSSYGICLVAAIVAPCEFGFNLVIEFSLEQLKISSVSTCWVSLALFKFLIICNWNQSCVLLGLFFLSYSFSKKETAVAAEPNV